MNDEQKLFDDLQSHFEQQADSVIDDDFTLSVNRKIGHLNRRRQGIFYAFVTLVMTGFGLIFWPTLCSAIAVYELPANNMIAISISVMLMLCCFIAAEE